MAKKQEKSSIWAFELSDLMPKSRRGAWKYMLPIWFAIAALFWFAERFGLDLKAVALGTFVFALFSNALAWLAGLIVLFPVVGPLIIKALALPFVWILNGVGYLVSFVAIRRGYSKDVITYRALTIALIVGVVIGFVIGYLTGTVEF